MASVLRYDVSTASKATRLDNGWLRVPAALSRAGVFEYRRPDGSVRRELRPADEVFSTDSLESFSQVPVTDDHPATALDDTNTAQHAVGSVGENVRRDGDLVSANLLITNGATITKVLAGKQEVSCGYKCDLDETPGVFNGISYDAIQRNIRGNHVALVVKGRAGPDVRLRMDSADAVMIVSTIEQTDPQSAKISEAANMAKVRLDGVDFEVAENVAQAFEKVNGSTSKALEQLANEQKALKSETDKQAARADAADAKVASLTKELAEAPVKVKAELAARMSLEGAATKILGAETKLDGLSERDVMVQAIAKVAPEFKPEGKSDDYVRARFDIAVEESAKTNPAFEAARKDLARTDGAPAKPTNSDEAYAKYKADMANAWKQPLASSTAK